MEEWNETLKIRLERQLSSALELMSFRQLTSNQQPTEKEDQGFGVKSALNDQK